MANFGIRLMFIIDAESRDEAAAKIAALMQAGCDNSGVEVDAAAIYVDALPAEMGGNGDAPDNKPRLSKSEQVRRDMIRRSCEERMN